MKRLVNVAFLTGFFLFFTPLLGLSQSSRLYINSPQEKVDHIQVIYEVTRPGFVELHLFDPDGEKIWIKGKVTDRAGVDYIRVPKKPLKSGKRYAFILKYKGKDHSGSFWTD